MKPACILALLISVVANGWSRTWTSSDGRTLEGDFVSATDMTVTVRRSDGRSIPIPLEKLSPSDRAYFAEQAARKPAPSVVAGSTNPPADADAYVKAVAKINDDHVGKPGTEVEAALSQKLPASAAMALRRLLAVKESAELTKLLVSCGEAALDLDRKEEFDAVRQRLAALSPDTVDMTLGDAVSRRRFIIRGIGKFDAGYLNAFADMFEAILKAYDDVFGFKEFSKVPGKKLRVRVHLEEAIKSPPHFAPQFPWHSEIDFPVIDPAKFASPTPQGQFLFYGLCHELGHVIAMWGDLKTMEDHHAWAHYTGVAVVEHLATAGSDAAFLKDVRDLRWRSLKIERELPENKVPPSVSSKEGVMALLIALHDRVGSRAIGEAINQLDAKGTGRRVNRVRYYSFADLRGALLATLSDEAKRKAVSELLPP